MQNWDKKWTIAAIAAVVLLVVGVIYARAAEAADKGGPTFLPIPEAVTKSAWTGCYLGASVGYGVTRSEFETFSSDKGSLNSEDVLLTPSIGCDAQISNMVIGLTADATFSNLSAAWESKNALDAGWQWFAGARGGFLLTPKTLLYGVVGYTSLDGGLTFAAFKDATSLGDLAGLTYGGGLETMFHPGWSLKLEYRYVSFGSDTAPDGKADGLKDGTDIDSGAHQVRLGAVYRFGAK